MKRTMKGFTTTLAALAVLCASVPASAGDMVPYKSHTHFRNIGVENGSIKAVVTGHGAHIGRFEGLQWTRSVGQHVEPAADGGLNLIVHLEGEGFVLGANARDGFSWEYTGGIVIPLNPATFQPSAPPPYRIYADATHTGGSGRFEGAGGFHHFEGLFNGGAPTTGAVVGQSDGEISSSGALKK